MEIIPQPIEDKQWLFGKTLGELQEIVAEKGMPRFTAKQIATWLYRKGVDSIDRMTDLSLKNRETLQQEFQVGRLPYAAVEESSDARRALYRVGLYSRCGPGYVVCLVAVGV